jgi:WXXGXW repeat (2 copies)
LNFALVDKDSKKGLIMKRSMLHWLLLSFVLLAFSAASFAEIAVGISVRIGPPALPVYAQPICPGPGFIWTPGYWAWSDIDGYYWVPGTWVLAPVGMLWTPGYWGWGGGLYVWHPGYWGPHVGFYGGINYGFGYTGIGFFGGEWRGERFYYNRSVTNVSVTNVTNVYNRTVIVRNSSTVSYNGGTGGVNMRPTPQEEAFARERHTPALAAQMQHEHAAMENRQNFAVVNHGRPAVAATARPADFSSHSVVAARAAGGEYHAPAMSPREARVNNAAFNRGNQVNRNNEGFRSFTSPAKNGASNANPNRGNGNEGFRSFTPPSRGGNQNSNVNGNRGNENRYNENRQQNQPQAHQNAPAPRPAGQAPHRQAPPPKEEHHR